MQIPDFRTLGTGAAESVMAPAPRPSESVASYNDAGAPGEALAGLGVATEDAGQKLKSILDVADVNNAYANVYAPKAASLAASYYALTGNAAVQARPQFVADMQQARTDAVGSLSGSAQQALQSMIQPHEEKELYTSGMHAGQQAIVYANQSNTSMINNFAASYSSSVNDDPVNAEDQKNLALAQNLNHLKQIGADDATIQDQQRNLAAGFDNLKQGAIQQKLLSLPGATQKALMAPLVQSQSGGLPQDMGGDTVRPYTSSQVENIRTQVAKPSPYDALFEQYGKEYGVDPAELKLHAVVESSLNPKADNGQSQGLMQISNANVKALGVTDPFDPAQSIEAAAKLMAQNQAAGATDTRTADKMYYGGPSASQQGPNTQQYAENLAAVRGNATAGQPGQVPNNPEVPAWLAAAAPSTIPKLAEMADASASREERLAADQNDAVVDGAKRDFFSKVAQGTATAQDAMNPNLPTDKIPEYLAMVAKGDKVDPNSPAVIKQRGVMEDMKVTDPQNFKAMDLSTLAGKLPAADISKLQADQMAMKKGDTDIAAQNKEAKAINDSVEDMLPIAWKNPKTDTDAQTAAAFRGNLVKGVQDAATAGGKPMGRDDIRKMASDMLGNVSVKGSGWFGDKSMPAYQVPAGTNPLNVYQGTPDNIYIPDSFREGISRAWQNKLGKPPQESDIRAAYLKSIQGNAQGG